MSAVRAINVVELDSHAAVKALGDASPASSELDLYFDLQAGERKQGCLASIAQMALSGMPAERLLHHAAELTAAALEAEFVKVAEYIPEEDRFHVRAGYGWRPDAAGRATVDMGSGSQAGYAFAENAAVIVSDLRYETRFESSSLIDEHGVLSGVSVPIQNGDASFGVLSAHSRKPGRFTLRDAGFLSAVAGTLGAAMLREKQDQEDIRRQLDRLTALRSIECAITASFELRTTLGVVLEEVMRQLEVDAAQILLLNKDSHTLESAACSGFRNTTQTGREIHTAVSLAGQVARERKSIHIQTLSEHTDQLFAEHLGLGEGFISYYGVPLIANGAVKGVLEVFQRSEISVRKDWTGFLDALARQAAIAIDNAGMYEEVQRSNQELAAAYDTTLEGWSRALGLRDHETQGHTQRVTEVTLELARTLGVPDEQLVHIRRGCLLHDIGKMGIPDGILLKCGPLTEEERSLMEMHTVYAEELLQPIPFLAQAMDIPAHHHEKWDGTGYPRGLKGEEIPLAARIFAVVDVWDALNEDRPYRQAWPADKVRDYIALNSGKHFDPVVANQMLNLLKKKRYGQLSNRRASLKGEP